MMFPTLGLALASATLVSAQLGGGGVPGTSRAPTTTQGPIGGQCAALGPRYYSACCATAMADPSCPTQPPIVGKGCGGLGPPYHGECCATAVNDPSCPSATMKPLCGPWGCGMTTSVVYTTVLVTVSDCPATVTNCPYRTKPVITDTIISYTTICPVSASTTTKAPVSTNNGGGKATTIYTTTKITITSCAPEVTNCPARTITSTIPISTTICPESNVGPVVPPTKPVVPPPKTKITVAPPPPGPTVAPPPVKSSNSGTVASQTSASIIQFTGAAEVKKVGTCGLVAGLLFALL